MRIKGRILGFLISCVLLVGEKHYVLSYRNDQCYI